MRRNSLANANGFANEIAKNLSSLRKFLATGSLRQNSLAIANAMAWCTQVGPWGGPFRGRPSGRLHVAPLETALFLFSLVLGFCGCGVCASVWSLSAGLMWWSPVRGRLRSGHSPGVPVTYLGFCWVSSEVGAVGGAGRLSGLSVLLSLISALRTGGCPMGPFAPFDEVLGCSVCAWCCQVTPKPRTYVSKCRPLRNRLCSHLLSNFGVIVFLSWSLSGNWESLVGFSEAISGLQVRTQAHFCFGHLRVGVPCFVSGFWCRLFSLSLVWCPDIAQGEGVYSGLLLSLSCFSFSCCLCRGHTFCT